MRVFISYRREDTEWPAKFIYDAFCKVLPRDDIFMDIDSISPGSTFPEALERSLSQCNVLLALIGPGWVEGLRQRQKLNQPDFVRMEVGRALELGKRVVPVRLGDAPFPKREGLPEDLQELVDKQAETIHSRTTSDNDVGRLIRKLRLLDDSNGKLKASSWPYWAIGAAAAVMGFVSEFLTQVGRLMWFQWGDGSLLTFHEIAYSAGYTFLAASLARMRGIIGLVGLFSGIWFLQVIQGMIAINILDVGKISLPAVLVYTVVFLLQWFLLAVCIRSRTRALMQAPILAMVGVAGATQAFLNGIVYDVDSMYISFDFASFVFSAYQFGIAALLIAYGIRQDDAQAIHASVPG